MFLIIELILAAGYLTFFLQHSLGIKLVAIGFLGMAIWLLKYDIAWINLRLHGMHRFIGSALLTGYVWLLVGALFMLFLGLVPGTLTYDAALHAIFLGFVFSMVFGHAPVIFPAVLRLPLRFHPSFYLPLALLHIGLVIRIAGDFILDPTLRIWGGGLDAVTILLYFAMNGAVSVVSRLRHPATET